MLMLGAFTQADAEAEYRRERIVADYAPRQRRASDRRAFLTWRHRRSVSGRPTRQTAAC